MKSLFYYFIVKCIRIYKGPIKSPNLQLFKLFTLLLKTVPIRISNFIVKCAHKTTLFRSEMLFLNTLCVFLAVQE